MGQPLADEDIQELENSFKNSNFFSRIFSIPSTVFNYVWNMIFCGPGVGRLFTERIRKHRIATVGTTSGELTLPIMKMPCFDLTFGFFMGTVDMEDGLYDMEKFYSQIPVFPRYMPLRTIETYWILNYRRPTDVEGRKEIMCYIQNELDGLIYLRRVSNNNLIDYEQICLDYENALEARELAEREMVKVESFGVCSSVNDSCCFNENCTTVNNSCSLPEKKQKDL